MVDLIFADTGPDHALSDGSRLLMICAGRDAFPFFLLFRSNSCYPIYGWRRNPKQRHRQIAGGVCVRSPYRVVGIISAFYLLFDLGMGTTTNSSLGNLAPCLLDGMELPTAPRELGDSSAIIFISSNREMAMKT